MKCSKFHVISRINAKNIRIIVTANDTQIELGNFHKLSCINGNMVALCYSERESEFLECRGFGKQKDYCCNFLCG